jgi:hypothetical protein
MSHYRIRPMNANAISMKYELFRFNPNESISTLCITEIWRFGFGFIHEEMEINLDYADSDTFYAKPDEGENEGCEFEGLDNVYFVFSDNVPENEREQFKQCYFEGDDDGKGGVGYIHEGEHEWEIDYQDIEIAAPVQIDFCDEDGNVIRQVELRSIGESNELHETLGGRYYVPRDKLIKLQKFDRPVKPTKTEEEVNQVIKDRKLDTDDRQ